MSNKYNQIRVKTDFSNTHTSQLHSGSLGSNYRLVYPQSTYFSRINNENEAQQNISTNIYKQRYSNYEQTLPKESPRDSYNINKYKRYTEKKERYSESSQDRSFQSSQRKAPNHSLYVSDFTKEKNQEKKYKNRNTFTFKQPNQSRLNEKYHITELNDNKNNSNRNTMSNNFINNRYKNINSGNSSYKERKTNTHVNNLKYEKEENLNQSTNRKVYTNKSYQGNKFPPKYYRNNPLIRSNNENTIKKNQNNQKKKFIAIAQKICNIVIKGVKPKRKQKIKKNLEYEEENDENNNESNNKEEFDVETESNYEERERLPIMKIQRAQSIEQPRIRANHSQNYPKKNKKELKIQQIRNSNIELKKNVPKVQNAPVIPVIEIQKAQSFEQPRDYDYIMVKPKNKKQKFEVDQLKDCDVELLGNSNKGFNIPKVDINQNQVSQRCNTEVLSSIPKPDSLESNRNKKTNNNLEIKNQPSVQTPTVINKRNSYNIQTKTEFPKKEENKISLVSYRNNKSQNTSNTGNKNNINPRQDNNTTSSISYSKGRSRSSHRINSDMIEPRTNINKYANSFVNVIPNKNDLSKEKDNNKNNLRSISKEKIEHKNSRKNYSINPKENKNCKTEVVNTDIPKPKINYFSSRYDDKRKNSLNDNKESKNENRRIFSSSNYNKEKKDEKKDYKSHTITIIPKNEPKSEERVYILKQNQRAQSIDKNKIENKNNSNIGIAFISNINNKKPEALKTNNNSNIKSPLNEPNKNTNTVYISSYSTKNKNNKNETKNDSKQNTNNNIVNNIYISRYNKPETKNDLNQNKNNNINKNINSKNEIKDDSKQNMNSYNIYVSKYSKKKEEKKDVNANKNNSNIYISSYSKKDENKKDENNKESKNTNQVYFSKYISSSKTNNNKPDTNNKTTEIKPATKDNRPIIISRDTKKEEDKKEKEIPKNNNRIYISSRLKKDKNEEPKTNNSSKNSPNQNKSKESQIKQNTNINSKTLFSQNDKSNLKNEPISKPSNNNSNVSTVNRTYLSNNANINKEKDKNTNPYSSPINNTVDNQSRNDNKKKEDDKLVKKDLNSEDKNEKDEIEMEPKPENKEEKIEEINKKSSDKKLENKIKELESNLDQKLDYLNYAKTSLSLTDGVKNDTDNANVNKDEKEKEKQFNIFEKYSFLNNPGLSDITREYLSAYASNPRPELSDFSKAYINSNLTETTTSNTRPELSNLTKEYLKNNVTTTNINNDVKT